MNQRGMVRAVSILSGLAMVLGVLALPSLTGSVGAADDGAECDPPGAIPIDPKHEAPLLNPNVRGTRPHITIDLPEPIVAGTYSVTLVSFDDHSTIRPRQTEEQWFARLLDVDGQVVYESPPTQDLPDDQNFLADTFVQQTVKGTATRLQAVHLGEGTSINSIHALCAVFTSLGRIIVEKKVTEPAQADDRFTFTADYAVFELGHDEQHDSGPIPAGMHSVSEEGVGGWETSAVCSDGSAPDAIDLQEGEIVTCTFTNTFKPDLLVTLDDAPRGGSPKEPIVTPGDPFDYVVNVVNLGTGGSSNVEAVLTLSEEVMPDIGTLDPGCKPTGTNAIVCSVGAVPVGEIIRVRVAVRVREDSPGLGTFVSSVVVAGNRDVEPTLFRVGRGIG